MDNPMTSARPLAVPMVEPAHFKNNLIRQVVCELRFPTLYELEGPRPPSQFAHALRKEYPNQGTVNSVNLSAAGVAQTQGHSFQSKRNHWTVTLRAAAISLETTKYDSFAELYDRLAFLLKAAESVIDTDFFTRVGIRYINSVPFNINSITEWVNPLLVGALGSGIYGDAMEHSGRVVGSTATGGSYLLQHGLGINPNARAREYVLDFDFSQEDVPFSEALKVASELHEQEYAMFIWALGEKAKGYLGPSTLNKRGI
jgi:uncharacterized protein (TIGR04255 family)